MYPNPFTPLWGNQGPGAVEMTAPVVIAASTTASAATALPGNPGGDGANNTICIENTTNGWAFCNFGDSGVAAATVSNGVGVPPGAFRIIGVSPSCSEVSVILAASATSGNVRFLRGNGIS
jgi:hypothetical protein